MILYHYSVDSYKDAESLTNDYKKQYRLAEPYLLALEKGEDCFWSVYLSAMSYYRELCAMGLRKHENYIKDAVEALFEYVRINKFDGKPVSRIVCVYYCETKDEAMQYLKDDCIDNGDFTYDQVKLLEVEVDADRVYRYDQEFYNQAMDVMEESRDIKKVMSLAESYFAQDRSENPLIEVLSDGENKVIREIPLKWG